ncbi:MAG: DUF1289 domain-containing protein [Chlorobi bacterium]|nr:DUF1289 domain-containing protein [Chlorobiota bacterium]
MEPIGSSIETPCCNVCRIDRTTKLCCGCFRSRQEIARWALMSPKDRRRIMAELPARRARYENLLDKPKQ